jgi:hypothetical protein
MQTDTPFRLDEALELLRSTPAVLRAWLEPLGPEWLRTRERPESWSPLDVVGHLIQGEREDWIPRARRILEHGESAPFEPFDRAGHAEVTAGRALPELLETFTELRRLNVADLQSMELEDDGLDRTGVHPVFGSVTLRELLATWVVHDQAHVAQIARILAARYGEAVGPWRHPDYLPFLTR